MVIWKEVEKLEDVVVDLKNKEIRGKHINEITIVDAFTTPEEIEEVRPPYARWLKEMGIKLYISPAYPSWEVGITKNNEFILFDDYKVIKKLTKEDGIKFLTIAAISQISQVIPPRRWKPEYEKIPVKIKGLEEVI